MGGRSAFFGGLESRASTCAPITTRCAPWSVRPTRNVTGSYPPHLILFIWPFGLTPHLVAYVVWCVAGIALYMRACSAAIARRRTMRDHWLLIAVWSLPVTIMFPAVVYVQLAPIVLIAFACWLLKGLAQGEGAAVAAIAGRCCARRA